MNEDYEPGNNFRKSTSSYKSFSLNVMVSGVASPTSYSRYAKFSCSLTVKTINFQKETNNDYNWKFARRDQIVGVGTPQGTQIWPPRCQLLYCLVFGNLSKNNLKNPYQFDKKNLPLILPVVSIANERVRSASMFRNLANFLSPTSFRTLSKNNFVALMATLAARWCCLLY